MGKALPSTSPLVVAEPGAGFSPRPGMLPHSLPGSPPLWPRPRKPRGTGKKLWDRDTLRLQAGAVRTGPLNGQQEISWGRGAEKGARGQRKGSHRQPGARLGLVPSLRFPSVRGPHPRLGSDSGRDRCEVSVGEKLQDAVASGLTQQREGASCSQPPTPTPAEDTLSQAPAERSLTAMGMGGAASH